MKAHVKNYFKFFGYGEQDIILCELCGKKAHDLHHIEIKGMGGQKKKQKELDDVNNIIALCRTHHEMAHNGELDKGDLIYIHRTKIAGLNRFKK